MKHFSFIIQNGNDKHFRKLKAIFKISTPEVFFFWTSPSLHELPFLSHPVSIRVEEFIQPTVLIK